MITMGYVSEHIEQGAEFFKKNLDILVLTKKIKKMPEEEYQGEYWFRESVPSRDSYTHPDDSQQEDLIRGFGRPSDMYAHPDQDINEKEALQIIGEVMERAIQRLDRINSKMDRSFERMEKMEREASRV